MFNNNIGFVKKAKIVLVVISLGIILSYQLVQLEIQGWNQAVALTTQLFNKPVEDVNVKVPHAQETYQNLIKWTFGKDYKMALAVATAENGTHECTRVHVNKNGSKDIGIFQINEIHSAKGDLYDCKENVKVAYQIFKKQGWSPWVVYQTGAYKKILN